MATQQITTDVTRRLDVLHWSKFHTMVTAVLGIGWLLDAFEVNIVGSVLGVIQNVFHLNANQASWGCNLLFKRTSVLLSPSVAWTTEHCKEWSMYGREQSSLLLSGRSSQGNNDH